MNSLIILFFVVPTLSLLLLLINLLLSSSVPDTSKLEPYECGFSPVYGQTRSQFSIHFYIVALLFLVFDLEILLLFPLGLTLDMTSFIGLTSAMIFFTVLTLGFAVEIGINAIQLSKD